MSRFARLLLLAIAAISFLASVPQANAQVVIIGRHHRHYRHHRHPYWRHHHRYYR